MPRPKQTSRAGLGQIHSTLGPEKRGAFDRSIMKVNLNGVNPEDCVSMVIIKRRT